MPPRACAAELRRPRPYRSRAIASGTTAAHSTAEEWILISHNRREIQQIMWDYVGIVRSTLRLERAQRRVDLISDEVESFYKRTKVTEGLIELRNIALCADLIIRCAMKRQESRGSAP